MPGGSMSDERRKYKRVLFTIEDGIIGTFTESKKKTDIVDANVMNISEGGVQLTFKPILNHRIKVGDKLLLTEIRGEKSGQVVVNVDAEVKWITEDRLSEEIGLGLEFVDVLKQSKKLNEFVEFWYLQKLD
jgi:c-di-GMP-binding flagellar brake protein YcgR